MSQDDLDLVGGQKPPRAGPLAVPKVEIIFVCQRELVFVVLCGVEPHLVVPEAVEGLGARKDRGVFHDGG